MARAHPGDRPCIVDELVAAARRLRRRLRERRCRLTVRPHLLDDRHAMITMLEGPQLLVDRHDRGLSQSLIKHGYWEMWLTEAIEAVLKPGMVAIDIGANVGYFTMLMAKRVGPAGRVYAFEPNPKMADLLRQSAEANGFERRITVLGDPLWDIDGAASLLKIPDGEPKNAHLVVGTEAESAGMHLLTRRLDSFPEMLDADLIKIDVEGAEEPIWRGMARLTARLRSLNVFLEYTPIRYSDPDAFLRTIEADGFMLKELSVSHGVRSVTIADVLAGDPREDRMLALYRP